MGWGSPDLYHQPEAFGLKVVGTVEWTEPCYSFDTTVVWEGVDEQGVVYYLASDAGCSCPSPFEYVTSLDKVDFTTRSPHSVIAALGRLYEQLPSYRDSNDNAQAKAQILDLTSKLMRR